MRQRILSVYFLFGFWAVLGQVIFLRETLVIFFGNEITLGLFYAVWFAGIAAGACLGSTLADRMRQPLRTLILLLPLVVFSVGSGVLFLRLGRFMIDAPVGELVPFGGMVLILIPSIITLAVVVGFSFPLACRVEAGRREPVPGKEAENTVGTVYVFESLGSLTAGLLHAFLFAGRFDVMPLFLVLLAVTFLVAVLQLFAGGESDRWERWAGSILALTGVVVIIMIITGTGRSLEQWSIERRWSSLTRGTELLRSVDSRYQNISLSKQAEQYNLYLNGFYAESFPDPYRNAVEAHFVVNQHPDPRTFLVIGSGITGFLDELLLYEPARVDYLEIDAVLIGLLRTYLPVGTQQTLDSSALHIERKDGRFFVKNRLSHGDIRYDMVIVNVPEPYNAMINRYYTRDFYRELAGILEPGGVVVASLPFTENYIRDEVLDYGKAVFSALSGVFDHVVVTPGARLHFFASNTPGVVTTDAAALEIRYRTRRIESEYFSPYHFSMLLQPERVAFVEHALSGARPVPDNTDLNPVAYYFGLKLWDRYSGGGLGALLGGVESLGLGHVVLLLVLFFAARVGTGRLIGEERARLVRFSALFSIAGTGMTGMSVSVILMYSFQSAVGYLYGSLGLLVALFMAGLAAGAWAVGHRTAVRPNETLILVLEALLLLFCFGLIIILPVLGTGFLRTPTLTSLFVGLLMLTGGILTGAEFPVSSALYIEQGRKLGKGAGMIDAFDHVGALVGAFLTGVLVVPVLGVLSACLLLAALKGTGVLFWLVCRVHR